MTTQVDLCNMALARLGTRSSIATMADGTPEANACSLYYQPCLNSVLSNPQSDVYPTYSWNWCRRYGAVTGATSTDPRWAFEFALPSDCVDVHEAIDPTIQQKQWRPQSRLFEGAIPYDEGIGTAGGTELVPVLWANLASVTLAYASNVLPITNWPSAFVEAFTAALAARLAITLTGSGELAAQMASQTQMFMTQAIQADFRQELQSTDYVPDWMAIRHAPVWDGYNQPLAQTMNAGFPAGYIVGDASVATPTPSWLLPDDTEYGVRNAGIDADAISNRGNQYISADTPDARIGVLAIGETPIGWRRPYHNNITFSATPGGPEVEASSLPASMTGTGTSNTTGGIQNATAPESDDTNLASAYSDENQATAFPGAQYEGQE